MLFDAHGDDLEDGEEDGRRCHGGWELQHGRDIRCYLGRDHHPVERIGTRTASNSPESHEGRWRTERLEGKVQ